MANNLFQLINSLSGSEKRTINLNLKTYSFDEDANTLLQDFNKIEHHLQLKRKKEPVQITSNQTRLYYKILDILFNLYKEQLYESENDNRLIKRSQILFHKGFYEEGVKQLDKVIYKGEAYSYLLKIEAIELRIKVAIKFVDTDYLKNQFEKEKQLLAEFSTYYFNHIEYESIWAIVKLESSTQYFYGTRNELLEKYEYLLDDEKKALSPGAKIYFNQINGFLAMKNKNLKKAELHMSRVKELFEAHKDLRNSRYSDYLRALRNICIVLMQRANYNDVNFFLEEVSAEINSIRKSSSPSFRNDVFTLTVLLRIDNILTHEMVDENKELISEFEKILKENESYISLDERSTTYYHLGLSYFILGDVRKALRLTTHSITFSKSVRKDIHHLGHILEICIHYSLGNLDLVTSKLNSFKRFLKKDGVFFSFEEELPKWINNLMDEPSNKQLHRDFYSFVVEGLINENKIIYKPFVSLLYLK